MNLPNEGLIPIIAILSTVALPIGFGMYLALMAIRSKHKENMEMLKQGIVPSDTKPTPNRYRSLRNGFLCVGIALGLLIGSILEAYIPMDKKHLLAASILLFLGLAYVLFYFITREKDLED